MINRRHTPVSCRSTRKGIAKLEVALIVAFALLALEIWPALGSYAIWGLDVRNWSRGFWFAATVCVFIALLSIRFAPEMVADWKARRQLGATEQSKADRLRRAKEKREAIERAVQSRRRRIY